MRHLCTAAVLAVAASLVGLADPGGVASGDAPSPAVDSVGIPVPDAAT